MFVFLFAFVSNTFTALQMWRKCIHVRLGACRSVIYGLGESDVALLRKILQLRLRNFEPLVDRVGHHAHVHA